ncbi:MAG: hypothetical protein ACYTF6_09375 [Planctomycetota bacterium]|jgi:hypothetical protein
MGQEHKQLILRPSKVKWGVIFALSVATAVIAAATIGIALAMVILAYGASIRLRASRSFLRLEGGGFSYKAPLRAARHRWADVGEFRVRRILGGRMVCCDINLTFRKPLEGKKDERAVLRLPDNYGMKPQALAGLMNEWRQSAISAQGEASHESVE